MKQNKKTIKDKDILGIFFSVYVVPVNAGTVLSGILALSKSLELCSSSHCSILKKNNSLVFAMMAAKFVLFKWILPLFVLIDIILV